jgi:hypothetical protein
VSRLLASLFAAAALFGAGGVFGAALSSGKDPAPAPTAQSPSRQPVEVRTVVKRRTIHVYRKPKRRHVAPPVAAPAPVAPAPAPVRAAVPVAPVPARAPLETRTSGSSGGEREHEDDGGEHESEGGDD